MKSLIYRTSQWVACWVLVIVMHDTSCAQVPFTTEGQLFVVVDGSREFGELKINPSNNSIIFDILNSDIGADLWVMGYRNTDRLVYGFDPFTGKLHRIDATGTITEVGMPDVDPAYFYGAGDISPGGRYLKMVGSVSDVDQILVTIDLEDSNFAASSMPIAGSTHLTDVTYRPAGDLMFGLDASKNQIVSVDPATGSVVALGQLESSHAMLSMYFDAFSTLRGFGTTSSGVASAIFAVTDDFNERVETTGPVYLIQDLAAAASTVDVQLAVSPVNAFPCADVAFTYTFGNTTGSGHSGITIEHSLPPGLIFKGIASNPLGGNVDLSPLRLQINDLTIPSGMGSIVINAEVGDVSGGAYNSQAELRNLPDVLGSQRLSDNPVTLKQRDETVVNVVEIEDDSISIGIFICLGEQLELDGTAYGNSWRWGNGSDLPTLTVDSSGSYQVEASSGCQTVVVTYEVSVASCPFTIELMHDLLPRETFPCSEVIYRFIVENDAGEVYSGIEFIDTLPEGFTVVELLSEPWSGTWQASPSERVIHITDMTVNLGFDTLDVLVAVGNLSPGAYPNQALVHNFPQALGPKRFSDDPATQEHDSTAMIILGVPTDTLIIPEILCAGTTLTLDGTDFGVEHHWFNGSSDPMVEVSAPGFYELVVFDGCDPTYVFFDVTAGDTMDVFFTEPIVLISLSDSVVLMPEYFNAGDTLITIWRDPLLNSLDCDSCLTPLAKPTRTAEYTVVMTNGVCTDSAEIKVQVDNTRRLFFPNVFSPNGDGVNDIYAIHSPDFGEIESVIIMDRWGQTIYESGNFELNNASSGWDGLVNNKPVPPGVYVVRATITFLDGLTEYFGRTITVLR